MLIDTHAHLYAEEFNADRDAIIHSALGAGVEKIFLPNINSASIPSMLNLESQFPHHCFAMIGLHPCYVKEGYLHELEIMEGWLKKRKFVAIGEIGLDFYWDKTFIAEQKDAFAKQIDWAKKYSLPIIIHQRECFDELFELVLAKNDDNLKGIFHCFAGTLEQATKIIGLGGFKLGIGGAITYKKSTLPEVVQHIGIHHLVLETDSPYLPPTPHRGKRNESSYLPLIAQKLAEVKNMSVRDIELHTSNNANELFNL
jgi:TatD DNase family protein